MDFVGIIMFAVLVALCVFFIVCGIQFGRGKWLGIVIKQKPASAKAHPSKKNGNARKEERAKKRQEEERLAIGASLSYVMFAAAFASFLQIMSQVLMFADIQPFATVMFALTLASYIGVFFLLFRTIRKIQRR